MKRRPKLDAGTFPSWEERIDYQLECALDRGHRLRETDLDLYAKVGGLEGRLDRAATAAEVRLLRRTVDRCVGILFGLLVLALLLCFAAGWMAFS